MVCKLLIWCDLIFGVLNCTLPEDTIDVDLKVHMLREIHTFRKDSSMQIIKCNPWGMKVQPYPSLKKKMVKFMKCRWIIITPFTNRPFQLMPKVAAKKCNLVSLIRPNRAKLSQTRKINIEPLPEATQQNWIATLGKAKDATGATTSLAPIQTSQLMDTPSTLSPTSPKSPTKFTEHLRYCTICIPVGKICPKEFPLSSDWDNDEKDED